MKFRYNYYCPLLLLFLLSQYAYGQEQDYTYKRELRGVKDSWHKIELPNVIFGKVKSDLSDIRIIGLQENGDTLMVPYLLNVLREERQTKEIAFKMLNQSRQDERYFYTLEVPASEDVNRIDLSFQEQNFDREVRLEGSQNQEEWFTILENYRIVSISNSSTDYAFTALQFPPSKYRYYRLSFNAAENPALTAAELLVEKKVEGDFRTYPIQEKNIREDRDRKATVIEIILPSEVPVSAIHIGVNETMDYYRPLTIQYLSDSTKTPKGWAYHYGLATAGTLSSLEEEAFQLPNIQARRLRIIIQNYDNNPLSIGEVVVKGNVHELNARFPEAKEYYLLYGNRTAQRPSFDLENFRDKIPTNLSMLQLGGEQQLAQKEKAMVNPLFQDQRWLWAIMVLMILLLGVFSLKMIRKA